MHDLEFRILGPIDASVTGKTVKLGGRRSRQVLAALLLQAGRPMSAERLIDAVWDDDPPASVRTQLAIQVSALRRAFEKAGCDQEVIETTATGYRLNDQAAWLDAEAAERALASAQALADREDAADQLRTALSWWRGPALTGLSTPDLDAAARRLGDLRLTIAEELYDVELALGRHRALIAELSALVAEEPWRERLRGQLMTAMWRSGRQADALEVYEEGRRLLVDDLGLEPGPELRELERAILVNDSPPTGTEPVAHLGGVDQRSGPGAVAEPGDEPVEDNPDARQVIPAELPPDVPAFIGRAEQIARMYALLTAEWPGRAPAFALAGTGGVGKSALAIHVGHRVMDSFPDGQLYVNLHGSTPDVKPLEPAEALSRLLRSLGVDEASIPRDADEAACRFRSVTSGKRLLIVLDNALDVSQVKPLLPASRSCRVIMTSRRILGDLSAAVHEQLDVLPETDAVRLLSHLIGLERFDHAAATEVVRLCGRLPLAVSVVASRLIRRPAWNLPMLADRLGSEARRLRELETDDRAIRASFEVGYRELDAEQCRMFRLLSQLDGTDVPTGAAASLTNLQNGSAERLLEDLVDAQLAESHVPGRYRLHDLLRLFARERAVEEDSKEERAAAVRRVAHYYLATARKACLLLNEDAAWRTEVGPRVLDNAGCELRDRDDVYAWLDSDGENLLAIARQAIASVDDGTALAAAVCSAVGLGWTLRGRHHDKLTLGELVLRNAGRTGDVLHQAIAHDSIGFGLVRCGDHQEALHHLQRAREGYRRAGVLAGEAVQLAALASAYRLLGEYAESIRHSTEAVDINRRIGRRTALADCLTSLGLTYRRISRPEAEIAAHSEALAIAESLEERNWAANVLSNLAEATRLARQPRQAKRYFEQAQEASLESESTPTFLDAEIWWGLGRTNHDLGDPRNAASCWQQSAAIMYELGLITADEKGSIMTADTPSPPDIIRRNT